METCHHRVTQKGPGLREESPLICWDHNQRHDEGDGRKCGTAKPGGRNREVSRRAKRASEGKPTARGSLITGQNLPRNDGEMAGLCPPPSA